MKLTNTRKVILNALEQHGAMTIPEICEVTGLKYRSLYNVSPNVLEQLKDAGEVHVCDWRRAEGKGGLPKPVYALGKGENVPYPGKKPIEEKYAKSRLWHKNRSIQKALDTRSITSIMLGTNPNKRRERRNNDESLLSDLQRGCRG